MTVPVAWEPPAFDTAPLADRSVMFCIFERRDEDELRLMRGMPMNRTLDLRCDCAMPAMMRVRRRVHPGTAHNTCLGLPAAAAHPVRT